MIDFYVILLILAFVAVMMSFMTSGFRKGAAHTLSSVFSLAAAAACLYFLSEAVQAFLNAHLGGLISGLVMLALVVFLYKIFHLFFSAINIIAKLPVVNWLDKGLGLVLGLVEGFFILYLLQYLLEHYLLV